VKRTARILVVANRTALSSDLERAMRERLASGPARFTLLVPMARSSGSAWIADHMAASLRDGGLDVEGIVCGEDPLQAVIDVWDAARFDEVIVSTLPAVRSRWMGSGLPAEIEQHIGAPVSHVEAGAKRTVRHQVRQVRGRPSARPRESVPSARREAARRP
jgi:hypothetical protein